MTGPRSITITEILKHPLVQATLRAFPGAQVRTRREGMMIDPNPHEIEALLAASPVAGEYIESLGRTDFTTWTEDEWMTFLEVVVTGYQEALQKAVEHANREAQAAMDGAA
ncbi:DUF6511 domain-containing protein [Roseomonas mucosa]|uniref:DUF6511 domain-containing protein n=1 Tax=Roseomonas mucosa TaxID=207340 RepID=UPI0030CE09B8